MSKRVNLRTTSCILNAEDNVGYLDIYGRIGKDWLGEGIDAKEVREALDEIGDCDRLEVRIHSVGGFVDEGQAIITALRRFKAEKHIFVDGTAASMASVILQAGDRRYCAKNATVFIHDPVGFCMGSLKTIEAYAENMAQVKEQILDAYDERSTLTRDEISEKMTTETRMTAEQALAWGFVDEIGDEVTADPANHASNFDDMFRIAADSSFSKLAPHLALQLTSGTPESKEDDIPMGKATAQANQAPEQAPESTNQQESVAPAADQGAQPTAAEIRAQEKQRIADINAMRQPGVEDLCDRFINEDTPAGEAAIAINKQLAANARNGQDQLEARRQQGNDVVTDDNADASDEVPASDEAAFEQKCEKDWNNNVGNCRSTFLNLDGFKAYQKGKAENRVKILSRETPA